MPFEKIHLTDLNEFLAGSFLEYNSSFEVEIKDFSTDGFIKIKSRLSDSKFNNDDVDFDLSGCECSGLDNSSYDEFINKAIYTASPYELIEFLLTSLSYIKLLICLTDGSWVIQILEYKDLD